MNFYTNGAGQIVGLSDRLASQMPGHTMIKVPVYKSADGELHPEQVTDSIEVTPLTVSDHVPNGSDWVAVADIPEGEMIDGKGGFKPIPSPKPVLLDDLLGVLLDSPTLVAEIPQLAAYKEDLAAWEASLIDGGTPSLPSLSDGDKALKASIGDEILGIWLSKVNGGLGYNQLKDGDGTLGGLGYVRAKRQFIKLVQHRSLFSEGDRKTEATLTRAIIRIQAESGDYEYLN